MISKVSVNVNYEDLKEATDISKKILNELLKLVNIGYSPNDVNELARELCKKHNVKSAFLGVSGSKGKFPAYVCVSVNDETLHTIPFSQRNFVSGDIVKVDFGIIYKGVYTDHCVTKIVGNPLTEAHIRLVEISKLCIEKGIENAITGNTTGDISYAMQSICDLYNVNYIKNYCSHGIGINLHMEPEILSYGNPNTGMKLEEGMVITVENQITYGNPDLVLDDDGWTLRTIDGSYSAMTEHMVIVRKNKAEVLTRL